MKTLTVSALVCAIMTLVTSCPTGWTAIRGRCFLFVAQEMNWARAERNCRAKGANLASVHNAAEYREIQKLILRMAHGHKEAWLGGSDSQHEGIWFWSDGTPFDYRHCGRFNNMFNQDCLQMNYGAHKCWDDVQCYRRRSSVCAKRR